MCYITVVVLDIFKVLISSWNHPLYSGISNFYILTFQHFQKFLFCCICNSGNCFPALQKKLQLSLQRLSLYLITLYSICHPQQQKNSGIPTNQALSTTTLCGCMYYIGQHNYIEHLFCNSGYASLPSRVD